MKTIHKNLDILPSARCGLWDGRAWCMVRRASGHNTGFWQWPGGKVELDTEGKPIESAEQAAIAEAGEETGVRAFDLNSLGIVELHPIRDGRYAGSLSITAAFWTENFADGFRLDHESDALSWMTNDEILRRSDISPETVAAVGKFRVPLLQ